MKWWTIWFVCGFIIACNPQQKEDDLPKTNDGQVIQPEKLPLVPEEEPYQIKLATLGKATQVYLSDHNDFFPPASNINELKELVNPYVQDSEMFEFSPRQFLITPQLTGQSVVGEFDAAKQIMFALEPGFKKDDGEYYLVVFLDGKVALVSADDYNLAQANGLCMTPPQE